MAFAAKPEVRAAMVTAGFLAIWIALSSGVVMLNKYILAFAGFPYPVLLTLSHMVFCAAAAWSCRQLGLTEPVEMDLKTYRNCVLPIAALFACSLWMSNRAYVTLSIALLQMLKSAAPCSVFVVGLLLRIERYSHRLAAVLAVVTAGAVLAAVGEINFEPVGLACQVGSIVTESFRLCLIQILLQSRGIKLNPINTLYYVAPACAAFLALPFAALEAPRLLAEQSAWDAPFGLMLVSAAGAFALNVSVFLLIGRTSALTLNVAGLAKDFLLIAVSSLAYRAPVTALQIGGYAITLGGIFAYQHVKQAQHAAWARAAQEEQEAHQRRAAAGGVPLSPRRHLEDEEAEAASEEGQEGSVRRPLIS